MYNKALTVSPVFVNMLTRKCTIEIHKHIILYVSINKRILFSYTTCSILKIRMVLTQKVENRR